MTPTLTPIWSGQARQSICIELGGASGVNAWLILLLLGVVLIMLGATAVVFIRRKRHAHRQPPVAGTKPNTPVEEPPLIKTASQAEQPLQSEPTQESKSPNQHSENNIIPQVPACFPSANTEDFRAGEASNNTRKSTKPINRGGRPRESLDKYSSRRQRQSRKPKFLKPEIICFKKEHQWIIAVEVPDEFVEKPGLTVLQNGSPLQKYAQNVNLWLLQQLSGEIIVSWDEADIKHTKINLGNDNYLLFKLTGQNSDRGRRIKSPSSGWYLVIVPETWKRDESRSGPPPVVPEVVSISDYQAHFFNIENGIPEIAFLLPDRMLKIIESKKQNFYLTGLSIDKYICDSMGPLFITLPEITTSDSLAWQNVRTIVVGEEGGGRRHWRIEFTPCPNREKQTLPPKIEAMKSGWYFIRFYNQDEELIESMDFRFASGLKKVEMTEMNPIPSRDGHKPIRLEFLHEPDCSVKLSSSSSKIQIERQPNITIAIIPPDSTCDQSRWSIRSGNGSPIAVDILIERIWWTIGDEDNYPNDWQDHPIVAARTDFNPTSSKVLWLRLPRHRWAEEVLVGFEKSRARTYKVKTNEQILAVPLREFTDCAEVENQQHECCLRFWITNRNLEAEVVILPSITTDKHLRVGWGRKKTAVAKVVMRNGKGEIKVNGKPSDEYFVQAPIEGKQFLKRLLNLKEVNALLAEKALDVEVKGSNPTTTQQIKAVAHAIARTLIDYDYRLKPILKQAGFGGCRITTMHINRVRRNKS